MKIKKLLVPLVAVCLAICMLALVACGGNKYADSKYVGTWNATTASYGAFSVDVSSIMDEFAVDLSEDGSATAKVNGESGNGTWEETETGIVIQGGIGETENLEFTDKDGKLTIEYSGATITFEKREGTQAADKEQSGK